jgi:hypothetical protein
VKPNAKTNTGQNCSFERLLLLDARFISMRINNDWHAKWRRFDEKFLNRWVRSATVNPDGVSASRIVGVSDLT